MSLRRARGKRAARPGCIEDVLSQEILADPLVDRDALNELLLDPSPLRIDETPTQQAPAAREPESRATRIGKLAGLVTAVAVLCGAVVAAAFLDRQRATDGDTAVTAPVITGARALAGFAGPGPRQQLIEAPDQLAEHSTREPGNYAGRSREVADEVRLSGGERTRPRNAGRIKETARTFYGLIRSNPVTALGMLDERLRSERPDEVIRAWRSITHVDVRELRVQPDGAVRADVTMVTSDSDSFRVTHLLRIDEGPPSVITEAHLLSSLHSPAPAG